MDIDNDGKRVRVMQKGWLDKKVWREINDILSLYVFLWDANDGRGFGCFLQINLTLSLNHKSHQFLIDCVHHKNTAMR